MPCSQHRQAKPAIPFVIVHPVGWRGSAAFWTVISLPHQVRDL